MSTPGLDPQRYKAQQRQGWGSVAAGWREHWAIFERGAQPLSDYMVSLAGIAPGQRVLDVATGIGEPAVTAARAVGPAGQVIGTDLAPEMLEIARERARGLGLANIEFLEMDAEALSFDRQFDAILCRLGLMFLPDLPRALERMRNLLVPGGRMVAATQAPPERFQLAGVGIAVVNRVLQIPPPPPGAPGPSALADPMLLTRRLNEAGFVEVSVEQLPLTFEFSSPEAFARFNQSVSAPVRLALAKFPERMDEVIAAIIEAARRHATPDGTVRLLGEVNVAIGRRPS
ncbi:MAG TPA: methyltransferase domain-containing protein [Methylomirabilota bacterium]|nr:methyltransferase domain-containing protein [Methylomirabilota bacterium]